MRLGDHDYLKYVTNDADQKGYMDDSKNKPTCKYCQELVLL